jgi:hypothetical protein
MKKENIVRKFLFALTVPALMLACDNGDEPAALSTDFGTLSSTAVEKQNTIVTIPLRNASSSSVSKLGVVFAGSATEGEDFTFLGITEEGVQIRIDDDQLLEDTEEIRVQLTATGMSINGNNIHKIAIQNDCEDEGGLTLAQFAGEFNATEKYGPAPADWYGPYHMTITQDATNPARFSMTNFYDSGLPAYFIVDIATKSVHFPNQNPRTTRALTNSSGTFDYCTHNGKLTLTIQLNYDGGDWEYEFVKDERI